MGERRTSGFSKKYAVARQLSRLAEASPIVHRNRSDGGAKLQSHRCRRTRTARWAAWFRESVRLVRCTGHAWAHVRAGRRQAWYARCSPQLLTLATTLRFRPSRRWPSTYAQRRELHGCGCNATDGATAWLRKRERSVMGANCVSVGGSGATWQPFSRGDRANETRRHSEAGAS